MEHKPEQWTYDGLGTVLGEKEKDKRPVICRDVRSHEDAYLIIAAPKMLTEYYEMLEQATGIEHSVLAILRATIARAKGGI